MHTRGSIFKDNGPGKLQSWLQCLLILLASAQVNVYHGYSMHEIAPPRVNVVNE